MLSTLLLKSSNAVATLFTMLVDYTAQLPFASPYSFLTQKSNMGRASASLQQTFGQSSIPQSYEFLTYSVIMGIVLLHGLLYLWIKHDYFVRSGKKNNVPLFSAVFFGGIITLVVYIAKRPQGREVLCLHCGKVKLENNPVCFHCGSASMEQVTIEAGKIGRAKDNLLKDLKQKNLIQTTETKEDIVFADPMAGPAVTNKAEESIDLYGTYKKIDVAIAKINAKMADQEGKLLPKEADLLFKLQKEQTKIKEQLTDNLQSIKDEKTSVAESTKEQEREIENTYQLNLFGEMSHSDNGSSQFDLLQEEIVPETYNNENQLNLFTEQNFSENYFEVEYETDSPPVDPIKQQQDYALLKRLKTAISKINQKKERAGGRLNGKELELYSRLILEYHKIKDTLLTTANALDIDGPNHNNSSANLV